ncbi:MAG: hypothetical protein OXH90_08555 [Paracoccaceae bacterium]|nr:hypothetical protein [Paracoccaceae bacterium]MDE2917388.1 hypothetical protein [Paracoccaceae bacterium]
MSNNSRLSFKIYGLQPKENTSLNAEVFVHKLDLLIKTLKETDQWVNGTEGSRYNIQNLRMGSVEVVLEEIPPDTLFQQEDSVIDSFQIFASKINRGSEILLDKSSKVIAKNIHDLCAGVGQSFSHAEFKIDGKKSSKIILDQSFQKRAEKTLHNLVPTVPMFKGTVYECYDGSLKEVDLRKPTPKARLILFVNKIELMCNCKSIPIQTLRDSLDKPVTVYAKATYNGVKRLPTRLDLTRIEILNNPKQLSEWQGKFDFSRDPEDIW